MVCPIGMNSWTSNSVLTGQRAKLVIHDHTPHLASNTVSAKFCSILSHASQSNLDLSIFRGQSAFMFKYFKKFVGFRVDPKRTLEYFRYISVQNRIVV